MKLKNISLVAMIFASVLTLTGCAAEGAAASSSIYSMLWIVVLIGIMFAVTVIPENKRKKKAQQMRDSIEVGDKITTIGGIVGKVVHVSEERVTFETGEDRVRLEVTKWAISLNEGKGANKETSDSEETLSN